PATAVAPRGDRGHVVLAQHQREVTARLLVSPKLFLVTGIQEHVPLAPYTTLRLGGQARYFIECASENEVRAALASGADRDLPVYILGGGSNVVFPDAGFPGLVVRITIGARDYRSGATPVVTAGVGV